MMWIRRAWRWLVTLLACPRRYGTHHVDELPQHLRRRTLYLVGEGNHIWCAAMQCPCGCRETVHLNLLADARPRWRVLRDATGAVTVQPSIWRQRGCRSHFFVRGGRIVWCEPTPTA